MSLQSGLESQDDAYAADSNEVMITSMTHALESIHFSIDTNCSATFKMLKLTMPDGFEAKIMRDYLEAIELRKGDKEIIGVVFVKHELWMF